MTEGNYYTDEEKVEQLESKLAELNAKFDELGSEYAIVCHFKQENEDLKREVAKLIQDGLESNDAHEAAFYKLSALRKALVIAANQLEGVAMAMKAHGRNLDIGYLIDCYQEAAQEARAALG